jgi:predicted pyridoxine 5'-phosphate oxidase superfamily flavin-nucleotide-binding protein
MGKTFDAIDESLAAFLRDQRVFFVATAPLDGEGHLNCSPKGLDTFAVLDPRTVAYLDLTGSGVETIAHLRENGRIVLMFAAFEGPPKIVRLHGRGAVVEPADERFAALRARFPAHHDGVRSVIEIAVERISDSCGYGVPRYELVGERPQMAAWVEKKGPEGLAQYRATRNRVSMDGLPGLHV